jgi:hypothetical protein
MAGLFGCGFIGLAASGDAEAADSNKVACTTAGPQAPRDIAGAAGSNNVVFGKAPAVAHMRLCDIHFHRFAEHRGKGFMQLAGEGNHRGYYCNGKPPKKAANGHAGGNAAHSGASTSGCGGISAGDTIEVHWVFTTCAVRPAPKLDSCFAPDCKNPQLRVEARVFHLEEIGGDDFSHFNFATPGSHRLPHAVQPVEYIGSTTGDGYNDGTCSPFQVTWNVSSACTPLKLSSLNQWCAANATVNPFRENHAHGVRKLVDDPRKLSAIVP